jgi:hypothetical protein
MANLGRIDNKFNWLILFALFEREQFAPGQGISKTKLNSMFLAVSGMGYKRFEFTGYGYENDFSGLLCSAADLLADERAYDLATTWIAPYWNREKDEPEDAKYWRINEKGIKKMKDRKITDMISKLAEEEFMARKNMVQIVRAIRNLVQY